MDLLIIHIVFIPFLGFLLLAIFGRNLNRTAAGAIGVGSVGLSALLTITAGILFLSASYEQVAVNLWQWFDVGGLAPQMALVLDPLSLVFVFVITFVGFLIHIFSLEYMREDAGFSRFFAYMNLFIGSMLILVLANNFLLLYLGWEGVGLCSFLLIGFWYRLPENNAAARKAFIVTRIGDAAMAIGLFLLYFEFRTLNISLIMEQVPQYWIEGSPVANAAALLLLAGAVGKSAQLPLQTWLPDAMAGPTPVSALIHAATMVTAGVYLIARAHVVFIFSPLTLAIVAIIGAVTLLIAGFSALVQRDIKKVLAYSTISQVGYMFLALGVGAWSAAVFHFMTHAFFKALLFLGAGVVIMAMDHKQDMFEMGGLKNKLPITFWTFLAGAASLAALPVLTAGFYSKDMILFYVFESPHGSGALWTAGLAGAFITALYSFRMVFLTFFGRSNTSVNHFPQTATKMVLLILAFFAMAAGFLNMPANFADFNVFSKFLAPLLSDIGIEHGEGNMESILQIISTLFVITGLLLAWWFYIKRTAQMHKTAENQNQLHTFLKSGFGFDALYHMFIVNPATVIARINKRDFVDRIYTGLAALIRWFNHQLAATQSGSISWYVAGIALGVLLVLTMVLTL